MLYDRDTERWIAIALVLVGWTIWALAFNAIIQRIFPTRVGDDSSRRVAYRLLTRGVMLAPFLVIGAYMSFVR